MEERANIVTFHKFPIQNNFKTKEEGRPVFEEKDFIKILVPGSRDVVDRPVQEKDKETYPTQWSAYENKQEQSVEGTPLREWGKLSQARVAEFEALNVKTVEQLSAIPDNHLKKFGQGIREIQKMAVDYLELCSNENLVSDLKKENKSLKTKLSKLEKRLDQIEAKNESTDSSATDS